MHNGKIVRMVNIAKAGSFNKIAHPTKPTYNTANTDSSPILIICMCTLV